MSQTAPTLSAPPDAARSHRTGILLCLLALFTFACQDALSKVLVRDYAVSQIIMVRFWAFAVFAIVYVSLRGGLAGAMRSRRPWLQIFRSALLIAEMIVFILALRHIGLADIHALFATFPLMATLLAVPVLGEAVGWRRILGVLAGFAGALVIVRPGTGLFDPAALIPLAAALMFALYNLMTRLASFHDGFETSMFYLAVVGCVCATAAGLPFWKTPDATGWQLLAAVSCTGIVSHMMLIKALEYAPASLLQPFNYTLLVWASVIGFFAFGELPDGWTVAGATLIVGSGGYVIWRERRLGRKRPEIAEPVPAVEE